MRISEAESQLMTILWTNGPTSAEDMIREATAQQSWAEGTVRTLIIRLRRKKAIRSRKVAGRAVYEPLIARADYVQTESQGLLDRLFGGEVGPLVAHFTQYKPLSAKDIETLKALIASAEE